MLSKRKDSDNMKKQEKISTLRSIRNECFEKQLKTIKANNPELSEKEAKKKAKEVPEVIALDEAIKVLKGTESKKIYYIENTKDDWGRTYISGYYSSLNKAKAGLKNHCDWYRPRGTGKIYEKELNKDEEGKLVYEN